MVAPRAEESFPRQAAQATYSGSVRFLPLSRVTLYTENPPDVVVAKLSNLVTTKWFSLKPLPQPFRGSIQGTHFKVVRVLRWGRNSWQPVVVGDVVRVANGTVVHLRMRLHVFVAAFMVFWFGGLLLGATMMSWRALTAGFGSPVGDGRQGAGVSIGLLVIAAMALAGFLMMSLAFWGEVKKAKLAFCEGLSCREVEPGNRLTRK